MPVHFLQTGKIVSAVAATLGFVSTVPALTDAAAVVKWLLSKTRKDHRSVPGNANSRRTLEEKYTF